MKTALHIADFLDKANVIVDLKASNKHDAIVEIVRHLADSGKVLELEKIIEAVESREKIGSTAVGDGVAIPHARSDDVKDGILAVFAISRKGVDFDSLDSKPVQFIFLLLTSTREPAMHVRALGLISKILRNKDCRDKIAKCKTQSEIFDIFQSEDAKLG